MNIRGVTAAFSLFVLSMALLHAQTIDLPTSKQLIGEIPGHPQRLNSLPISMAVSPDGRYVVTVNAGYGTFESKYEQSLAVLDTQTGALADFPDDRTAARQAKQTLYSGLAFSRDGSHLYASMGSITDPTGEQQGRHRERHRGLQLRRGQDRAGALHPSAAAAARPRAENPPDRTSGMATRAFHSRRRLRSWALQARRSCWSPTISPTMCC